MQNNILIVGSGGREYAIGRVLLQDSRVKQLYFAPGNVATKQFGININYKSHSDILSGIRTNHINLVIIGPEQPLSEGLSDFLRANNVRVFAPSQAAARLETSKAFMKDFITSINIPTARYIQSNQLQDIFHFIDSMQTTIVLKADGLCAGKGVIITQDKNEAKNIAKDMIIGNAFGEAGKRIVVEEYLDGYELSVFAICDGDDFILLPVCQDHKRLLSNDKGPNTGGMGAYAPTPLCDDNLLNKIASRIIAPTLLACKERGFAFEGVLFAGIMVVDSANTHSSNVVAQNVNQLTSTKEPYLLEFNVRFGDPECEVLMPLLKTPLLDIVNACVDKQIKSLKCEFKQQFAVAVVASSKAYPYASSSPKPIMIKPFSEQLGHIVYAGVSADSDGNLLADGGRVLLCVGVAESLKDAKDNAYKILESVHFDGMHFRDDIAYKALQ